MNATVGSNSRRTEGRSEDRGRGLDADDMNFESNYDENNLNNSRPPTGNRGTSVRNDEADRVRGVDRGGDPDRSEGERDDSRGGGGGGGRRHTPGPKPPSPIKR